MSFRDMTFQEVLEDLQSRFIINVPPTELSSIPRICFQIEQAHWFYEDFIREENPHLPTFSLKNFCKQFFHTPILSHWATDHESAFQHFMEYKVRVPVCGAIILNPTLSKVLLVRGWKANSGWGFPKGKINQDEPEAPCAIREVKEETGFDITSYLDENAFVERNIKGQRIRLYICVGVPETTVFVPMTRKEIGDIRWHELASLPGWVREDESYHYGNDYQNAGGKGHRYYMVTAFITSLRAWIAKYRRSIPKKERGRRGHGGGGERERIKVVMDYQTTEDEESDGYASLNNGSAAVYAKRERQKGQLRGRGQREIGHGSVRIDVVEERDMNEERGDTQTNYIVMDTEQIPEQRATHEDSSTMTKSIKALIGIGVGGGKDVSVGVRVDEYGNGGEKRMGVAVHAQPHGHTHTHGQHPQNTHTYEERRGHVPVVDYSSDYGSHHHHHPHTRLEPQHPYRLPLTNLPLPSEPTPVVRMYDEYEVQHQRQPSESNQVNYVNNHSLSSSDHKSALLDILTKGDSTGGLPVNEGFEAPFRVRREASGSGMVIQNGSEVGASVPSETSNVVPMHEGFVPPFRGRSSVQMQSSQSNFPASVGVATPPLQPLQQVQPQPHPQLRSQTQLQPQPQPQMQQQQPQRMETARKDDKQKLLLGILFGGNDQDQNPSQGIDQPAPGVGTNRRGSNTMNETLTMERNLSSGHPLPYNHVRHSRDASRRDSQDVESVAGELKALLGLGSASGSASATAPQSQSQPLSMPHPHSIPMPIPMKPTSTPTPMTPLHKIAPTPQYQPSTPHPPAQTVDMDARSVPPMLELGADVEVRTPENRMAYPNMTMDAHTTSLPMSMPMPMPIHNAGGTGQGPAMGVMNTLNGGRVMFPVDDGEYEYDKQEAGLLGGMLRRGSQGERKRREGLLEVLVGGGKM